MNGGRFHPWAWIVWTTGVCVTAVVTRNPWYQGLLWTALLMDLWFLPATHPSGSSWRHLLWVAGGTAGLSAVFNVLIVHEGRVILFRLPAQWPLVGGPITAEALMYGLATGLSLVTVITLFALFQREMPPSQWLRVVPGFMYLGGMVTAIGLAFFPATWQAARDIYDAQRLRGHRFHRVWDYAALVAPLLVDSLERSLQLAEALTARGFGAHVRPWSSRSRVAVQAALWVSLAALATGAFLRTYRPAQPWGAALLWGGVTALLLLFYLQGRRVRRTRYRRWYWRRRDTLLAAGGAALLLSTLAVRLVYPEAWFYYPYPPYSPWPEFRWFPGITLLLAALPAWLAPAAKVHPQTTGTSERPIVGERL